jgi:hypothetical protein
VHNPTQIQVMEFSTLVSKANTCVSWLVIRQNNTITREGNYLEHDRTSNPTVQVPHCHQPNPIRSHHHPHHCQHCRRSPHHIYRNETRLPELPLVPRNCTPYQQRHCHKSERDITRNVRCLARRKKTSGETGDYRKHARTR